VLHGRGHKCKLFKKRSSGIQYWMDPQVALSAWWCQFKKHLNLIVNADFCMFLKHFWTFAVLADFGGSHECFICPVCLLAYCTNVLLWFWTNKHDDSMLFLLQQHGSVYWRTGAEEVLMSLDSAYSMAEQLAVRIRHTLWCHTSGYFTVPYKLLFYYYYYFMMIWYHNA